MRNEFERPSPAVWFIAILLALGFLAAIISPADGYQPPSGNPHHEEADGCDHGNTGKPCRPDPQPDHGKDCVKHGNHGGINEDHCASATPTPTPTPDNSTSPTPSPSEGTSTSTPNPSPTDGVLVPDLPNTAMHANGIAWFIVIGILLIVVAFITLGAIAATVQSSVTRKRGR